MRYLISMIGLVAIVGTGYFAVAQYVNVAHGQSSLISTDQGYSSVNDGAQVLALLNTLNKIKLDGKIFSNPNFLTLQDWSVEIAPQTIGRSNPYLPVSGVSAASSSAKVLLQR